MDAVVTLKPGREKSLLRHHPWVFSGAVAKDPNIAPGTVTDIQDASRQFLARGYYNPHSQIRLRVLTWRADETIDRDFWRRRISASIARRSALRSAAHTNAYRLVNSESDQLPGLIVDQYDSWLVVQALTAGMEAALTHIVPLLAELCEGSRGIYERSDDASRKLEGLPLRAGLLWGEEPPDTVEILENGMRLLVDLKKGHKTGFYLDQRENRALIRELVERYNLASVLNCFSFSGGFSVAAALGGASSITTVDSSAPALTLAKQNLALNGRADDATDALIEANVFELLRQYRSEGRRFDLIVLDPPKFAQNAGQLDKACRGYKDLNMLAFQLLAPNGLLATFSCSGLVSAELFQKVVFSASEDARCQAQVIGNLRQAEDHPVLLAFPEAFYLKGLICRKLADDMGA